MIYNLDYPVNVTMFGHVTKEHGRWHNGIYAPNHIVLYCTEGELNINVEGRCFQIKKGGLLLIPYGSFYVPLDGEGCSYYFFHFNLIIFFHITYSYYIFTPFSMLLPDLFLMLF